MKQGLAAIRILATLFAVVVLASGCATSRSEIDIAVEKSKAAPGTSFVKLADISDKRRFQAQPSEPSIPSLKESGQISDSAITSRAIGRKRNAYGMALGDILLPEPRKVTDVVRDAVTRALNDKGYAVAQPGTPEYDGAPPLQVDVQKFWSWMTPGMWLIGLEFESDLLLTGAMVTGEREVPVRGYHQLNAGLASETRWSDTMQAGIDDLIAKIIEKLRAP